MKITKKKPQCLWSQIPPNFEDTSTISTLIYYEDTCSLHVQALEGEGERANSRVRKHEAEVAECFEMWRGGGGKGAHLRNFCCV